MGDTAKLSSKLHYPSSRTRGLRPWKPGQSGNPVGRPRNEHSFTNALRQRLNAQDLADKLVALIDAGDIAAIKYAYDRLEGSPRTSGELTMRGESLDEVANRVAQRVNGDSPASD